VNFIVFMKAGNILCREIAKCSSQFHTLFSKAGLITTRPAELQKMVHSRCHYILLFLFLFLLHNKPKITTTLIQVAFNVTAFSSNEKFTTENDEGMWHYILQHSFSS
jgi:hypothetical protein